MASAVFNIKGMTCQHCVQVLESVFSNVKGVKQAKVSLKDHQAVLAYEGTLEAGAVLDAAALAGYEAALTEVQA